MQTYKAYGLIIKRTNLGEADRIVTAFTKEYGKIKFVAKGSRKIKSKLAGSIEPFYYTDLLLSKGKNLDILISSTIQKIPLKREHNLEMIKTGSLFVELTDKMMPEDSPNEALFNLLEETFNYLGQENNFELIKFYLENKFFKISGYFPETFVCVVCGKKPLGKIYFSCHAGGIVDNSCYVTCTDSEEISINEIKIWRFASEHTFAELKKIKISDELKERLANLSSRYLEHVTQRRFKSDQI